MLCYIYKSLKKDELYLYLSKKDDFTALPDDVLKSFGHLQYVMEIDITPERKLARDNARQILESIDNQGFYIQMPPTATPFFVSDRKLH